VPGGKTFSDLIRGLPAWASNRGRIAWQSLRLVLERRSYACAEVADGVEAVELARRHRPRYVLLDLAMPRMDGLAVARRLRSDPRSDRPR
jgi:CheY-like chemotaxis protein